MLNYYRKSGIFLSGVFGSIVIVVITSAAVLSVIMMYDHHLFKRNQVFARCGQQLEKLEKRLDRMQLHMELFGLQLGSKTETQPRHMIRLQMIQQQVQQAQPGSLFLLGDSITEAALFSADLKLPVVNLGVGGMGVAFFHDHTKSLLSGHSPAVVVVALGVNDTSRQHTIADHNEYACKWASLYKDLLSQVREAGAIPVIVTILPVAHDLPLGDRYFNPELIRALNEQLRLLAKAESVKLVDLYNIFAQADGSLSREATIDGVHLSADSYRIWRKQITNAVDSIQIAHAP